MSTCIVCKNTVYAAERLWFNEKIYHNKCFGCTHCKIQLRLNTVRSFNKEPYCHKHSPSSKNDAPPVVNRDEPPSKPSSGPDPVPKETPTLNPTPPLPVQLSGHSTTSEADKSDLTKSDSLEPSELSNDAASEPQESEMVPTKPKPEAPSGLHNSMAEASSHATVTDSIDRQSVLASGYDAVQAQIEIAAQSFTADPVTQQKIFDMFSEFNIIVCGSARVGKSTLINALCGRKLTQASPGLDSCTKNISRYILKEKVQVNNEWLTYMYNFWDTPGFESWNQYDIQKNFSDIIRKPKSDPLCMIYCASPGSFANTEQIKWLLDYCILERNILCALVVTNKWAGTKQQRTAVLEGFKRLLSNYTAEIEEDKGVTYFGNVAICTMINAEAFIEEEENINRAPEGIDELIEAIMNSLQDEGKVFHWCMATMQKKGVIHNLLRRAQQSLISTKDLFQGLFGSKKKSSSKK